MHVYTYIYTYTQIYIYIYIHIYICIISKMTKQKMHKTPIGARFIVASKNCAKPLI